MDRIEINGVWYVKEDNREDEPIKLDVVETQGCVVENEDFCYDATRIANDKGGFYDGVDIKVTDKREKPWKEDYWDNNAWIRGVLINDPESLGHLRESVCLQGEAEFKAFFDITDKISAIANKA